LPHVNGKNEKCLKEWAMGMDFFAFFLALSAAHDKRRVMALRERDGSKTYKKKKKHFLLLYIL
jgi:hypothetical protein